MKDNVFEEDAPSDEHQSASNQELRLKKSGKSTLTLKDQIREHALKKMKTGSESGGESSGDEA